jgi:toxin CptA
MAIVSIALIGVGTIAFLQFLDGFGFISVGVALAGFTLALVACSVLRRGSDRRIRLTIAENGGLSLIRYRKNGFAVAEPAEIVQMMPGSTLWPFFILLRLRQQNKKMIVVPFFAGNLSPELFRRLSIACRWIAARNDVHQPVYLSDED